MTPQHEGADIDLLEGGGTKQERGPFLPHLEVTRVLLQGPLQASFSHLWDGGYLM